MLLSSYETSKYLNISKNKLWKMYKNYNGDSPNFPQPIRIGSSTKWKQSDLDTWIDKQQAQPQDTI